MRVTLHDIAQAANTSVSTVSRVLNGHPAISAENAARIRQAAKDLEYRRRQSHGRPGPGQVLAKKKIALMSLGMDRSLVAIPVVTAALHGAEAALSAAGASVLLAHVPELDRVPPSLEGADLDGAILFGPMQGDDVAKAHGKVLDRLRRLPSVWVLGRPTGCWGDSVGSSDSATGAMAAEYLAARGHRHLAFVNPKPNHLLFSRREDGFVAAARRHGAEVRHFSNSPPEGWTLPLQAPDRTEVVQRLVDNLLATEPRPTAIFAAADSVAALVYRALAIRELQPGRDISIISANNDYALIAALHPHLTTFDIHAEKLGHLAVRQLALRMADPEPQPCVEVTIEATLVDGESVETLSSEETCS